VHSVCYRQIHRYACNVLRTCRVARNAVLSQRCSACDNTSTHNDNSTGTAANINGTKDNDAGTNTNFDFDTKTTDFDAKTIDFDAQTTDFDVKTIDFDAQTTDFDAKTIYFDTKTADLDNDPENNDDTCAANDLGADMWHSNFMLLYAWLPTDVNIVFSWNR
jgi:hypothetical protein